jgi:prefoldin subunit 4
VERLEADKEAKEEEVRAVEVELASIRGRLSELKKSLYARFGKNINLEEQ